MNSLDRRLRGDFDALANEVGYTEDTRSLFNEETKQKIKAGVERALIERKFGHINAYMVFPSNSPDYEIVLANDENQARLILYTHKKKIAAYVSLAMEKAAVLNCEPRIITEVEEAFALGCQFAARHLERSES